MEAGAWTPPGHGPQAQWRGRGGRQPGQLTCEAEIRETSCRPVRSEEETLAGAPLCSLMLTFLSLSTREIALGEVLPRGGEAGERPPISVQAPITPAPLGPSPRRSPACWMREAGVEATGSAALRSRLAAAPVGGPGGRARVAEPRSCPILSSRSCSRRSRSTSSGFRAAPCGEERRPGQACEVQPSHGAEYGKEAARKPSGPTSSPPGGRPGNDSQTHSTEKAARRRKLGQRNGPRALCPGLMELRQSWEG